MQLKNNYEFILSQEPLQSSFLKKDIISAVITRLRSRSDNNDKELRECDYSQILCLILPYYFKYENDWCILPEYVAEEAHKPYYTMFRINLNHNIQIPYGSSIPYAAVEIKQPSKISWMKLLGTQMWNQASALSNQRGSGRCWMIGVRGFEICFFQFDLLKYNYGNGNDFDNFKPLNLRGFSKEDFEELDIKFVTNILSNQEVFVAIGWRLDWIEHSEFIDEMFKHILNNQP